MSTPAKLKLIKTCIVCTCEFKAVMIRGQFCSGRCRVQYWRERKGDTVLLDALIDNQWHIGHFYAGKNKLWTVLDGSGCPYVAIGNTPRAALIEAVETLRQQGASQP